MSLALPDILFEKKYDGMWEWDGAWPVAKAGAPEELKEALVKFKAENQSGPNEKGEIVMV